MENSSVDSEFTSSSCLSSGPINLVDAVMAASTRLMGPEPNAVLFSLMVLFGATSAGAQETCEQVTDMQALQSEFRTLYMDDGDYVEENHPGDVLQAEVRRMVLIEMVYDDVDLTKSNVNLISSLYSLILFKSLRARVSESDDVVPQLDFLVAGHVNEIYGITGHDVTSFSRYDLAKVQQCVLKCALSGQQENSAECVKTQNHEGD